MDFNVNYDLGFPQSLKQDNRSEMFIMPQAAVCRQVFHWMPLHSGTAAIRVCSMLHHPSTAASLCLHRVEHSAGPPDS